MKDYYIDNDTFAQLQARFDQDGDGTVTIEEFVTYAAQAYQLTEG